MDEFARCHGRRLVQGGLLALVASVFLSANADAANWTVDVGGAQLVYSPATLTITAGDTVTFTNQGGFHNVAADDGLFRCAQNCSGSGGDPDSTLWSSTVTLASPGTVGYHCEVHGAAGLGMFGTITVQPAPPVQPPPQSAIDTVPGGSAALYLLLGVALIVGARLGWRRHSRAGPDLPR
jgi:plastocyanin